jgi:hypothetical protein
MIIYWIFWLIVPGWKDLILNPLTGKVSQKNLFGVMGFYVGTVLAAAIALTQLARGQSVDTSVIMLLTVNGLGLAGLKIYQQQANRQTATPEGQPLAAPLPPGAAPPIMEQVFNPNAPETRPLAGYNDNNAPSAPTE